MNANLNSTESFNELVFENRNKEYGAYVLRKSYNDNVTRSLILTCAFFGLLTLLGVLFSNTKVSVPDIVNGNTPVPLIKSVEVILPERKKVEPQIEQKKEAPLKTDNGQLEASNNKTETAVKPNDQMNISKNANPNGVDSSAGKKDIIVPPVVPPTPSPAAIEKVVTNMPEFDDMAGFISRNLQYPRAAVENGTSGTVFVTFVVEMDGSITDVQLLKGIGDGCEQEAIRVVKLFPKWKPGMNHGKLVRVQCNLPVKFRLK